MPALILQTVQLQVSHTILGIFTQEPGARTQVQMMKYKEHGWQRLVWLDLGWWLTSQSPHMDFGG